MKISEMKEQFKNKKRLISFSVPILFLADHTTGNSSVLQVNTKRKENKFYKHILKTMTGNFKAICNWLTDHGIRVTDHRNRVTAN